MRGFYKVHTDAWPLTDDEGNARDAPDCVVLAMTTTYAYLHSARYPNPALEVFGAALTPLGSSWAELYQSVGLTTRKKLFDANISRLNDDGKVVMRTVRVGDVKATDGWDGKWMATHAYSAKESPGEQVKLDKVTGPPVAQELQGVVESEIQEPCPEIEDDE